MKVMKMLQKEDLLPIRFGPKEWMGALGDMGTLLPIFLSLVALNNLPPIRSLVLVGLVYIGSALYFRVPLPVQPLKAMAAIAIAQGLDASLLSAAGVWMGLILLTLSLTGKIQWLEQFFTKPVVKGIQLGVGLMLIKTSVRLIADVAHSASGVEPVLTQLDYFFVLWVLVLPQLPLTLGNAVFAVTDVARDYFHEKARRVSPKNLCASLGAANLVTGALGGLPLCHGSGGMTAHYRFGARGPGATMIMGGLCIMVAILFADRAPAFLALIPSWMLGVMVLYVGICHAQLVWGSNEKRVLSLLIGLIGLATHNLAYALIFGLLVENAPRIVHRIKSRTIGKTDPLPTSVSQL